MFADYSGTALHPTGWMPVTDSMSPSCGFSSLGCVLALLALLGSSLQPVHAAVVSKRSYGFRVQSRDREFQHTFRRALLRNATMPLHGAVKDYG